MSEWLCTLVKERGTQTSGQLQPMFDAFAGTARVSLFPGTAYLCADAPISFPDHNVPLTAFEHLSMADHQRGRLGYSPRLYPVSLGGRILAWVFRWSADDVRFDFIGPMPSCVAENLVEVISPVGLNRAIGSGTFSMRFVAA